MLKFGSYVHVTCLTDTSNEKEVCIFKHRFFLCALEHDRLLILGKHNFLRSMITSYKYCHIGLILSNIGERSIFGASTLDLSFGKRFEVDIRHLCASRCHK